VVHAAFICVPASAGLALACLRPWWGRALRWWIGAATAVATATVFVARESGEKLKTALGSQIEGNITGKVVDHHEELANQLQVWLLVMLVVVLAVALLLPRLGNPLAGGAMAIVVAALAVVVIVMVARVGDEGSKARWNPDGSFDYSGEAR
jgi:hypothetical protein